MFMSWAISSGVIDYALDHLAEIEKDMVETMTAPARQFNKKRELSPS